MTQKRIPSTPSFLSQRLLLVGGIGWLSSFSLISAGGVLAQVATPPEDASTLLSPEQFVSPEQAVPSAEDLLQPEMEAPSWQTPVDIEAIPQPAILAPEADVPPASGLTEDTFVEEPSESAPITPDTIVSPNLQQDAIEAFGTPGGEYIDSTDYSLGATQPDIVVSERSTGCQAVIQPGQTAPAAICPAIADTGFGQASSYESGYGAFSGDYNSVQPGDFAASARDFFNLTARPPARLSNGNVSLLFPLSIPAAITSAFGWRLHPVLGGARFHSGTDIGAPQGTPVLAAFDGKVEIADMVGGYGLTVVLQHNKGTEQTLYGHLSEIFVEPGDEVKQGEVVGRVGSTGLSTGPHLHFEFRKLTQEGWVVMDAGSALEQALAQFVQGLQVAQVDTKGQLPSVFKLPGKALRVAIDQIKPNSQSQTVSQTESPQTESPAPSLE